ncbi:MAG: DUF6057 family protein [Prevotella sp.]|jgi:hypothetical protein|nr:DUF6057 family protein [Prevotella sp.]
MGKKIYISKITLFCFTIFGLTAFLMTAVINKDFLLWADETALFLPTRLFFCDKMQTPGGLLSYLGLFFNQFFAYPWLGSILFILLQGGIVCLLNKAFRIPKPLFPLTFIPCICLLTSLTDIGYILYRNADYLFSNTLGIIAVLSSLISYQHIKRTWQKALIIVLFVLFTYPLFGFYTLLAALLFVIYSISSREVAIKNKLIIAATALLSGALIPALYFNYHYAFLKEIAIYTAGLPNFYWDIELELWLPFLLLYFSLISFSVSFFKSPMSPKSQKRFLPLSWAIYTALLITSCFYYQPDVYFKAELAMNHAIEANDWQEVVRIGDKAKSNPTRLMVMNYNLALFKLDKAGDEMFKHNQITKQASTLRPDLITLYLGAKPIYFQYGRINYCYRWCVEDMIKYGMSVQGLKYMVKCAIAMGDFALAQKYNNVLKKSFFHKSWAEDHQQYIDNPESFLEIQEIKAIRPLLSYDDLLDGDNGLLESYIRYSFAYMEGKTLELIELSLLANLTMKNIERFWSCFSIYTRTHNRIPVHFQEAALLYAGLEGKPDISALVEAKFDKAVVDRFEQVVTLFNQNVDKSEEYNKAAFKSQFGDTYYYYYFFVYDEKNN